MDRNRFIEDNKSFIYNTAYNICKRKLSWENDDELSISLIAFNNACNTFKEDKGNFYSYAKVIIKNSLIDYFRKRQNTPYVVFSSEDEEIQYVDVKNSLNHYSIELENKSRAEEILEFSKELSLYKLDFNILIKSSPSHKDTRDSLLNIAFVSTGEETIINYIREKKMLPIKEIMLLTGCSRKLLEKWRRYILILILILSSHKYPYIKSYLNIKVGDCDE